MLLRFADDTYTESYISTIGVDFVSAGKGLGVWGGWGWTGYLPPIVYIARP